MKLTTFLFFIFQSFYALFSFGQEELINPFEYSSDFIKEKKIKEIKENDERGNLNRVSEFDTNGNMISFNTPTSRKIIKNKYDENGILQKIEEKYYHYEINLESKVFYDQKGRIDSIDYSSQSNYYNVGIIEKRNFRIDGKLDYITVFDKEFGKNGLKIYTKLVRRYVYNSNSQLENIQTYLIGEINGKALEIEIFNNQIIYSTDGIKKMEIKKVFLEIHSVLLLFQPMDKLKIKC